MTIIPAPGARLLNGGKLVITSGIRDWVDTGVEPWASEPNPDTLGLEWRLHYLAIIVTSHLSGDQGEVILAMQTTSSTRLSLIAPVVATGFSPCGTAMGQAKSSASRMTTAVRTQ